MPTSGHLLIWPPLGHTTGKLRTLLREGGFAFDEPADGCLSIALSQELVDHVRDAWPERLTRPERADCRCLLTKSDAEINLGDIRQVISLETLLGRLSGRWLVEVIAERRLQTVFQPIVSVSDPGTVVAHECLLRARGAQGEFVSPAALFDAARQSQMLFHLDRAARLRHIRSADECRLDTDVFINFNPTAIYDPEYCLRSTVAAIDRCEIHRRQFVFEVVESDEMMEMDRLAQTLDFYRDAGFRVALDDLGAGFGSLNLLAALKPDIVKLDMGLMRGIDSDRMKATIVSRLLAIAGELGVQTVVEGIETVAEWQWALEHRADFAQGYLFAKPSARPTVSLEPLDAQLT